MEAYYARLGVAPEDLEIQRRRMAALGNRGDTLVAQGDLAAAAKVYGEAKGISERLAAADPGNAGWQLDLAKLLARLALLTAETNPDESHARFVRALGIVEGLDQSSRLNSQDGRRALDLLRKLSAGDRPAPPAPSADRP